MKGCRSLTDEEIASVYEVLGNTRDRLLFVLGCKTGLRISELLSLTIGNVLEHGQIASQVTVAKKNTKGKKESKTLPLTEGAKKAILEHLDVVGNNPKEPLFRSNQSENAITRIRAHKILKKAFSLLGLKGKTATHSMRKSYAHRVHEAMGNRIEMTQKALCHRSLSSTASYIQVDREEVEKAILGLG